MICFAGLGIEEASKSAGLDINSESYDEGYLMESINIWMRGDSIELVGWRRNS
jgi:hypothetical protein